MKDITYIDFDKFGQIIRVSGLDHQEQAGFVKVSGERGRNVYVARTKRVGRVDVSGFKAEFPGVTDLGDMSFGKVEQQLDFNLPEDDILRNFRRLLGVLKAMPAAEPTARTRLTEGGQVDTRPASDVTGQGTGGGSTSASRRRARRPSMQPAMAQADREPVTPAPKTSTAEERQRASHPQRQTSR